VEHAPRVTLEGLFEQKRSGKRSHAGTKVYAQGAPSCVAGSVTVAEKRGREANGRGRT